MKLAKNLSKKIYQEDLAEKQYFQIMRQKSGQARLKISLELRELVLKLTKAQIKERNPKISLKELNKEIQKRIYGFSFASKIGCK